MSATKDSLFWAIIEMDALLLLLLTYFLTYLLTSYLLNIDIDIDRPIALFCQYRIDMVWKSNKSDTEASLENCCYSLWVWTSYRPLLCDSGLGHRCNCNSDLLRCHCHNDMLEKKYATTASHRVPPSLEDFYTRPYFNAHALGMCAFNRLFALNDSWTKYYVLKATTSSHYLVYFVLFCWLT